MTSFSRAVSAPSIYAGLVAGAVVTLAPLALGLMTSFTSAEQFNTGTPLSWPSPPTLENYAGLADVGFGRALVVTALMTSVILVGQLTCSVFAAYAFARLQFPGRDALFWVYLATLVTSLMAGSRQLLLTPRWREGPVQPVRCYVQRVHLPGRDASIAGRRSLLG